MNTLVVEKSALKNNLSLVKQQAESSYIYANLSGDGHGIGAVPLALLLRDEGIRRFCVDRAETAVALREAGLVDEEILMLHATSSRETLERLADHNVICSVGTLETGMALNALAESRATVIEAHLQIDCGMGFGGFPAEEPEKIIALIQNLPNVAFSGVYTQLASDKSMDGQLAAFQQAVDAVHAAGCETGIVHAAGSYAMLHSEFTHLDAVRAGSILLGRCRRRRGDKLSLVGYGETTVDSVRWLPKGHTVGSDYKLTLKKPTRVAVLPVGYQNGFGIEKPAVGFWAAIRRARAARRRTVRIGKHKAKVLGAIGATETLVNVTGVKCAEGDTATFELNPLFAKGMNIEYR
jgi:alanine racemase